MIVVCGGAIRTRISCLGLSQRDPDIARELSSGDLLAEEDALIIVCLTVKVQSLMHSPGTPPTMDRPILLWKLLKRTSGLLGEHEAIRTGRHIDVPNHSLG